MADLPNKLPESPPKGPERVTPEPPRSIDVEKKPEAVEEVPLDLEEEEDLDEDAPAPGEAPPPPAPVRVAPAASAPKDPFVTKIEDLLAEDLTDAFLNMSPGQQAEFKRKGEETAGKIREMIAQTKVNARKVFDLIREWLKLIPGVNRFFLEQEAKIKTDKILRLKP